MFTKKSILWMESAQGSAMLHSIGGCTGEGGILGRKLYGEFIGSSRLMRF